MLGKKKTLMVIVMMCAALFMAGPGWANIPAPPANQQLGIPDSIFNNLTEADCRACHDDPAVIGGPSNVDRHHMLYGSALPVGVCSTTADACRSDADCDAAKCEFSGDACASDADCDVIAEERCGETCRGDSAVPEIDANNDGSADTVYACLNCHEQVTVGGVTNFMVERDCLQCHIQIPREATVHHLSATAQGFDSPLGDPDIGDCTPCHGSIVDDIGDGHVIPTYAPSMVTPSGSGGDGLPLNSEGNGAGACNYCHSSGTGDWGPGLDNATGTLVYTNNTLHHETGVYRSPTGGQSNDACLWCHFGSGHDLFSIRHCEGCHGMESLHNIQADSPNPGNIGSIVVGGEDPGYGHVGSSVPGSNTDDCWGCHGFAMSSASAPGSGPTAPYISSSNVSLVTVGTPVQVTLSGSAFTNTSGGVVFNSQVKLTLPANGNVAVVDADSVSESTLTFTLPAGVPASIYEVRAIKAEGVESNPVVITVKPDVIVTGTLCESCTGVITIRGNHFGDAPPAGTEDFLNVMADGVSLEIISWTDTEIQVLGSCDYSDLTVNALMGAEIAP